MGGTQVWNAIAQALAMTTQDLTNQLKSGKTLAQIAGSDKTQAVKDAIVNAIKPQLDQAITNKKMTQDQENQIISKIQNSDLNNFGGKMDMGRGKAPRRGNNATPTPNSSSSFFRQGPAAGNAL